MTALASIIRSFTSFSADFRAASSVLVVTPSGKCGSAAKSRTKIPTTTLIMATRWKAILHPAIPMNEVDASRRVRIPPIMDPRFPVSCNHPKAEPRVLSLVESATRDWMAGVTRASPTPFNPLAIATCTVIKFKSHQHTFFQGQTIVIF